MGRSGGLSSKRRSSKKKRLRVSSEARRKKQSKRHKSKKLRRHDDSISSYSDDVSISSSLDSSSSSEGEYRSKRAPSRSRDEFKASRKRTRRSSSTESSDGSSPVKKKKGSKKKEEYETRKKKKKKNKKSSRRDSYISPASSDSASCSTCRGGNSSSDEGAEVDRPRGGSREKKKYHRDSRKGRNGRRKNRSRPRSSSSPSELSNSYVDDSIEKVLVENNPRRLKSVITVVKRPEEEERGDTGKDELKEEMVYDYDDYPSCRSNDSNEGGNKKELVHHSNFSSEKRVVENVVGEVDSASTLKVNKSVSSGTNASKEYVDSKEKETNASGNIGSEGVDLESILRQKALENLSRFRGRLQTKAVPVDDKHDNGHSSIKQLPTADTNLFESQGKQPPSKQDNSRVIGISQPVIQRSRFTWRRYPSVSTGKEEKAAAYSGVEKVRFQAAAPKSQSANLSSGSIKINESVCETSKFTVNTNHNSDGLGISDAHKSSIALETPACASIKEGSSKEEQTETKDSSQFEQKTMSVMRGGEMVQVSYKVYIPKKSPALARRQLKR